MALISIETADGSRTLFDSEQQVHFRSLDGAQNESNYVFIESSLIRSWPQQWSILELGFGTAMNFRQSAYAARAAGTKLIYTVVEHAPITGEKFRELTAHQPSPMPELDEMIAQLLDTLQERDYAELSDEQIELKFYHQSWQNCQLPPALEVQAIYHDPFGPRSNPDCWGVECFRWEVAHLHPQGRLVTYAAATDARRAMVQAGLAIGSLPGAGRKREMTVAAWSDEGLEGTKLLKNKRFYV